MQILPLENLSLIIPNNNYNNLYTPIKRAIMIKVEFLGPINKEPIELEVSSVQELSVALSKDIEVSSWLASSAVAVNDTMIKDLDHPLKDGDRVSILPPVCGG